MAALPANSGPASEDALIRFLQKILVSICVIAFDVNFIEDRKSVAIGDF
ncbi:MAG: hypothetical protein LKJ87_04030 [Bacteroidales bacterium]|nr:hypothetical protein [Bacteroidales bacterium]